VSKGRLTRQELGWLLTQEAAGAADRLRKGVETLKTNYPPAPTAPSPETGVDGTLAALDDAMRMLSNLHSRPVGARGRRGRIDLASLLWEVAPDARVSIEPGGGTEVFGEEAELRRMLHLLVGHGSGAGSAITIRRDGDYVRIGVTLGPDSSASAETERAWLSRMAIRSGGTYELEGGMESLALPADGVDERDERAALRKELDEAREQGAAYARELAQVFTTGEEPASQSSYPPPQGTLPADRVETISRFAGGLAAALRDLLSPMSRELAEMRNSQSPPSRSEIIDGRSTEPPDPLDAVRRRLQLAQDLVAELSSAGEIDVCEGVVTGDLVEATRHAVRSLDSRAQRAGVVVDVVVLPAGAETAAVRVGLRGLATLLRSLVGHAISATPRGRTVKITVGPGGAGESEQLGSRFIIDDAGTSLPASARRALLALEVEPGTYGRPSALPLYIAGELVAYQGGILDVSDSPTDQERATGVRVSVTFPRL
jgi:two-component system, OmpR family, sensor kinase